MKIEKNLKAEEYFADGGLSNSKMSLIDISPAHYQALKDENKKTDALEFGTMFHCFILEPEKFNQEFAIMSENFDKRTKAGKELFEKFCKENETKTIVTKEAFEIAKQMQDSIMAHPIASKLVKAKGECEVSIFWNDKENEIDCKMRADKIINNANIILDLKTSRSAKPSEFMKHAYNFKYHRQAAHYLKGYKEAYKKNAEFIFLVVEKEPPYAVCIFKASEDFLELGNIDRERVLKTYAECLKTGEWKGYDPIIHELNLPAWAYKDFEEE